MWLPKRPLNGQEQCGGFQAVAIVSLEGKGTLQRNRRNLEFSHHGGAGWALVSSGVNECLGKVGSVVMGDAEAETGC